MVVRQDDDARARADLRRQHGMIEAAIERGFRYIEMTGVTALLLVAVGNTSSVLSFVIGLVGSALAGFYVTIPIALRLLDYAVQKRWGRRPGTPFLLSGIVNGLVISATFFLTSGLTELIKAALQS